MKLKEFLETLQRYASCQPKGVQDAIDLLCAMYVQHDNFWDTLHNFKSVGVLKPYEEAAIDEAINLDRAELDIPDSFWNALETYGKDRQMEQMWSEREAS
jgi:hypothetical protein